MKIFRDVNKTFIHTVHMDIFPGNIPEINAVNLCGVIQIELHSRHSSDILDVFRDFMDPAPVLYPKAFHCRSNSKTYRGFGPCRVCHNQICLKWVQSSFRTFYGSIKRFQIITYNNSDVPCCPSFPIGNIPNCLFLVF